MKVRKRGGQDNMNTKTPSSRVGIGLIVLSIVLLGVVAGFALYDQLATWVTTQTTLPDAIATGEPDASPRAPAPTLPTEMALPVETSPTAIDSSPHSSSTPPPLTATVIPTRPPAAPAAPAQLIIPRLKITRPIVTIDRVTRNGQTDWDTDKLFATRTRPDLVGHLKGTGGLGAGNTVLSGHNYNRGIYNWRGVFYDIGRLSQGDIIYVVDQEDRRFAYQVVQVEKVNWPPRSDTDLAKTIQHLTATADETLTLVTCGGAILSPFPARLYVTAKPIHEAVAVDLPTATPPATAVAATPSPSVTVDSATATPRPAVAPPATTQAAPATDSTCRATVTVKRGDTLARIARANGVSMRLLAKRNGITNPDRIRVGQQLCIP